jgi:hypothetical protein
MFWTPYTTFIGQVGLVVIFEHFSDYGVFLLQNHVHARPPANNANHWVV